MTTGPQPRDLAGGDLKTRAWHWEPQRTAAIELAARRARARVVGALFRSVFRLPEWLLDRIAVGSNHAAPTP